MMSYLPEDLHCSRADMEATSEIQPFREEDRNRCMHIHKKILCTYTVCVLVYVCDITQVKVHTN